MVDDSDYYGSIIDFNAFSLVVDEVWRTLFKKYITTPTPLNEVRSIPYSLLSSLSQIESAPTAVSTLIVCQYYNSGIGLQFI
jgi:hypothetical protein